MVCSATLCASARNWFEKGVSHAETRSNAENGTTQKLAGVDSPPKTILRGFYGVLSDPLRLCARQLLKGGDRAETRSNAENGDR